MSHPAEAGALSYAVITAAKNEAGNLPRLAQSLAAQTVMPSLWVIVDDGSSDGTYEIAVSLGERYLWVRTISLSTKGVPARGGPVVRAFHEGLAVLDDECDVIVKLDADVSMDARYFERLLDIFRREPSLGMASGSGYELEAGEWTQRHVTGSHVWGPARAYRRQCLMSILPLEERMGWDGVDELKANVLGWSTRTVPELAFYHHRLQGRRDGARRRHWANVGAAAHYMGYRPSYVVFRAAFRGLKEPSAIALVWGWASAALRREPQYADARVREHLRANQTLRMLPARAREALGRRRTLSMSSSEGSRESAPRDDRFTAST
jgi:glycosyltransferase involved in cell wall biosynthesis